jgi:dihydrofolate synthase/folylpolyglutamate synthase
LPLFPRVGPLAFPPALPNITALCQILESPQNKFPSIHIAGTNGKGSVAHMLAAILTASGLKVGLYTSPHYKDFRERVKINGALIPKKEVVNFVEKYQTEFDKIQPSFFEWTVALAFDYFAREKVDVAVIETGLGGRLDSTNIIKPILSIITNIGYDHQQFLGDTLPKIASEKAGIIKPKIPVVIGETHPETKDVFIEFAKNNESPIYFADQEIHVKELRRDNFFTYYKTQKTTESTSKTLALNHLGDYQKMNLKTVLKSYEVLNAISPHLVKNKEGALVKGLKELKKLSSFQGRWEVIDHSPTIICDSAHNAEGMQTVIAGIKKFNYKKLHIVIGMVNDKSHYDILSLFPQKAKYYFAKANIPRGLPASELKNIAEKYHLKGKAYTSVRRAFSAAKKSASKEDLIFVGGSIFVVAEVL